MSFSRINYDESAYNLRMERSKAPGEYRLNGYWCESCDKCLPYNDPTNSKSQVSLVKEPTDLTFTKMAHVESILTNRVKKLQNGNLEGKNNEHLDEKLHHAQKCNNHLEAQDTRFTNPLDTYRGMSLTSYAFTPYLHVNPQCQIQSSKERNGSSSRLLVKDTYNMPDQNAWDKGKALPPDAPDFIEDKKCKYVCDKEYKTEQKK